MLQDVVCNFGQEMEPNWTKCKKEICFIVEGKVKAFSMRFLELQRLLQWSRGY